MKLPNSLAVSYRGFLFLAESIFPLSSKFTTSAVTTNQDLEPHELKPTLSPEAKKTIEILEERRKQAEKSGEWQELVKNSTQATPKQPLR